MRRPTAFSSLKVVGVVPRDQTDELSKCNEPGQPWFQQDPAEFVRVWCRLCRNPSCNRAKGGLLSPWSQRMREQPEYLLNNPIFSPIATSEHKTLAAQDFASLNQKAERLEVSAKAQDWNIPTQEPVLAAPGTRPPPSPKTPNSAAESKAPAKKQRNTPVPSGGHIIGGSSPPVEERDSWTPTAKGTIIQPGTKIVLR